MRKPKYNPFGVTPKDLIRSQEGYIPKDAAGILQFSQGVSQAKRDKNRELKRQAVFNGTAFKEGGHLYETTKEYKDKLLAVKKRTPEESVIPEEGVTPVATPAVTPRGNKR